MTARILPVIDELNRPFWEACRDRILSVQECGDCARLRYPIAPVCPACLGRTWSWTVLGGAGAVYTFAVFRHSYNDAWQERVPYAVAIVQLDEGVMMIADLADIAVDDVRVGLRVQAEFEPVTAEIVIPHFVPAGG
jgi:uncharacterized OB-fold protein